MSSVVAVPCGGIGEISDDLADGLNTGAVGALASREQPTASTARARMDDQPRWFIRSSSFAMCRARRMRRPPNARTVRSKEQEEGAPPSQTRNGPAALG